MAEALTWAVLLARWTEFARSAVALPTDGQGGRWRASVAPIIGLQATALALRDLDDHDLEGGRALAIDTASVGVDRYAGSLVEIWGDEPWPEELHELIADARQAIADAMASGLEWTVSQPGASLEHPAELAGALEGLGFGGELYCAAPGVVLSSGCPCAFLGVRGGDLPDEAAVAFVSAFLEDHGVEPSPSRRGPPRQVYRQFDFGSGRLTRDFVTRLHGDPQPGQPLLVGVVSGGQSLPVALPQRRGPVVDPPPLEFDEAFLEADDAASEGTGG